MCVYVFIFEKDYLCKIFSQINQKKTIIFLKKKYTEDFNKCTNEEVQVVNKHNVQLH